MSLTAQNLVHLCRMYLQGSLRHESAFRPQRERIGAIGEFQEIGGFERKLLEVADVGDLGKRRIETGMGAQVLHVPLNVSCRPTFPKLGNHPHSFSADDKLNLN